MSFQENVYTVQVCVKNLKNFKQIFTGKVTGAFN